MTPITILFMQNIKQGMPRWDTEMNLASSALQELTSPASKGERSAPCGRCFGRNVYQVLWETKKVLEGRLGAGF